MAVFSCIGPDWPHGRGDIEDVVLYTGHSEDAIRQMVSEGRFPRPRYKAGRGRSKQWYAEDVAFWRASQCDVPEDDSPKKS